MFDTRFDDDGACAWIDAVFGDAQAALRPAAQVAAQVLYGEALVRVPVSGPHVGKGGKLYPGGSLKSAIYQAYSSDNSNAAQATYHISWNAAKAPHGHLVEYGHWQPYKVVRYANGNFVTIKTEKLDSPKWVPAHSFIRASHDAKAAAALQAGAAEWLRRMKGQG
jgi:hypothetical protein